MATASRGASLSAAALLVVLALAATYAAAENIFYVGGDAGWTGKRPPTDFQQWANSNHFQVNDKLIFKYNKSEDSVMQVTKPHYDTCDYRDYIRYMGSGESVVTLSDATAYYYVSGNKANCQKGQKMVVQVSAATPTPPPSTSPSPAPSTPPHTPIPSPAPKSPPPPSSPKTSPAPPTHQPPSSPPEPVQPPPPTPSPVTPVITPPAPAPAPSSASPSARLLSSSLTVVVAVAVFLN